MFAGQAAIKASAAARQTALDPALNPSARLNDAIIPAPQGPRMDANFVTLERSMPSFWPAHQAVVKPAASTINRYTSSALPERLLVKRRWA